ncbi:MAG: LD-carboxypeptidase [Candidatus Kapabacteria bacterium]|nr:LD-carboxypeptidase [Candidatus Kapabacteria bacterium]
MRVIQPPALERNATIGIISPSSPQRDAARLERGVAYLESLGYTVKLGRHALASHGGYLAGTDVQRVEDLHEMFMDPQVSAIFCARGGYGCARLLPLVDFSIIRRHPKIFVGFSDVTVLQLAMLKRTGLITFSGAMPSVDMADGFDAESEEQFWQILTSRRPMGSLKQSWPLEIIRRGQARGRLMGGNLSVLVSLIGTGYLPPVKDSILVLEDVGEATYRIDRMLVHLAQSTRTLPAAGTIYGSWSQPDASTVSTPHRDVAEVLRERTDISSGPILSGLKYGHHAEKFTLPIGAEVMLRSARGGSLTLLEAAVR